MRNALELFAFCFLLASGAGALEITGTVPESVRGAAKGDFDFSGLAVKNIAYEKGAVIMPVTENKGRTYADVKLLSKALYEKIELCFRSGCPKAAPGKSVSVQTSVSAGAKAAQGGDEPSVKISIPVVKVEELKPLKSKTRVANAEVSFDGELLAVLGVMASSKEPGTFWIAFPDTLEFKDQVFKAAVEKTVKAAWAKNKK